MKYKYIGIFSSLFIVFAALLAFLLMQPNYERYHQHLAAQPKVPDPQHSAEGVFSTHLPLLEIETNGVTIPGRPIYDDKHIRQGYTLAEDGSVFIPAHLEVTDHPDTYNYEDDPPTMESLIRIHLHGYSSRDFDKPNYTLKLLLDNGEENDLPLLGMSAHHDWILHGPFLDKTLLQNYMWYNIAGEIMSYAPNVRFCELMLNGEYQGVYLLTERVSNGKRGGRLPLSAKKHQSMFSGYLLRLDRGANNAIQDVDTFTHYTYRAKNTINIEYPGLKNLTKEGRDAITKDFSKFEKALYSYDFANPIYGYPAYIDVDSFVDYFLINELTCNYDAGSLSTYIYKAIDGKFYMCVWDFNNACDHYQEQSMVEPQRFEMQRKLWFEMLVKDPKFTDRLIKRYRQLRKNVFSDAYLDQYIDDVVDYLGPAIGRNNEKWGYSFSHSYDRLLPADRNPRSYEEAIQDTKDFLHQRTAWMDDNIETLRQYSVGSHTKQDKINIE